MPLALKHFSNEFLPMRRQICELQPRVGLLGGGRPSSTKSFLLLVFGSWLSIAVHDVTAGVRRKSRLEPLVVVGEYARLILRPPKDAGHMLGVGESRSDYHAKQVVVPDDEPADGPRDCFGI